MKSSYALAYEFSPRREEEMEVTRGVTKGSGLVAAWQVSTSTSISLKRCCVRMVSSASLKSCDCTLLTSRNFKKPSPPWPAK